MIYKMLRTNSAWHIREMFTVVIINGLSKEESYTRFAQPNQVSPLHTKQIELQHFNTNNKNNSFEFFFPNIGAKNHCLYLSDNATQNSTANWWQFTAATTVEHPDSVFTHVHVYDLCRANKPDTQWVLNQWQWWRPLASPPPFHILFFAF